MERGPQSKRKKKLLVQGLVSLPKYCSIVLRGWSEQLCQKCWHIDFGRLSVTIFCICLKIKFVFDKRRETNKTNKTSSFIQLIIPDSLILMGNRYMTYAICIMWEILNYCSNIFGEYLKVRWLFANKNSFGVFENCLKNGFFSVFLLNIWILIHG